MTGYGKDDFENEDYKISVEIKTVNHKYCNIYTRIPSALNSVEERIKKYIKKRLKRGRIEVNIYLTKKGEDQLIIKPNFNVLDQYYNTLTEIKKRYKMESDIDLNQLVKYDNVLSVDYNPIDEEKMFDILKVIMNSVIDSVVDMRQVEGEKLEKDIENNLESIEEILKDLSLLSDEIVEKHRESMRTKINELLMDIKIDEDRLEQEIAIYADKTDINEEIIRIKSHLNQFKKIFAKGGVIGRKMDFLAQELNREINTIGSKSPDVNITNYVVELKSLVGKIREQIQNIE
jgi:uncharacterized protein (TIGR00255 family)